MANTGKTKKNTVLTIQILKRSRSTFLMPLKMLTSTIPKMKKGKKKVAPTGLAKSNNKISLARKIPNANPDTDKIVFILLCPSNWKFNPINLKLGKLLVSDIKSINL